MNVSKTGVSFSAGPAGAAATLGTSGARGTMSLPGTGLFYTVDKKNLFSTQKRDAKKATEAGKDAAFVPEGSPLMLGFFERLTIPKEERTLVEGFKALVSGDHARALVCFEQAPNIADARWIAGMIRLKQRAHAEAEAHLNYALKHEAELGALVGKYQVEVLLRLPITEEVSAHIQPRRRGTLLALAESYQDRGALDEALHCLKQLIHDDPTDPVVILSLVELMSDQADPVSASTAKQIVQVIGEVDNESDIHAALMMHKAEALLVLGLGKAALETLTAAHRKKKDRDPELLRAIRYQRALVYEQLGQKARARSEFEALYALDPGFEDVAQRLGLA